MDEIDSFGLNIKGVQNLVESGINKTNSEAGLEEGTDGEYVDALDLPMSDEELLKLKESWLGLHNGYYPKIKPRQEQNKMYYVGKQRQTPDGKVVSSNLIFESEETYIPQALSKNPEPVVWSDNTAEGKAASNDMKTMLQYHADVLCLRKKLGVMVRHHSIYLIAVLKHGWDAKTKDIKTEIRKPQNFIFDPNGFVDEYGDFKGAFLGEKIETSAEKLIEMFPEKKAYIIIKANGQLGTMLVRTEWWTDDYCFTTFEDVVLDKHKNEYFNYDKAEKKNEAGDVTDAAIPGQNHFSTPKMPYTFLSVYSLQETPHDITNLIEQSIPNQDRINDRDDQITKNLRSGNNSLAVSGLSFTSETAREAAQAVEDGDPILVPDGRVEDGIKRLPANSIPAAVFTAQQNDKDTLRSVFGVQGLVPTQQTEDTTARGMILNQSHDATRIGGGIGDALEQVADNVFNWWAQLYYVFYDEAHYGAIMGNGRAVEYVTIINSNLNRNFVISVAPNSMTPKDEITEMNQAIDLWKAKALDPVNLFKKLNYPDPMETAKQVSLWITNPQLYIQTYFPEQAQAPDSANPPAGGIPPQPGSPPQSLSQEPANASLSQVPLPQ